MRARSSRLLTLLLPVLLLGCGAPEDPPDDPAQQKIERAWSLVRMLGTADIRVGSKKKKAGPSKEVRFKIGRIGDRQRSSIVQRATSSITFEGLRLSDKPVARFFIAVDDWAPESEGIQFSISVATGAQEKVVFQRHLAPAKNPRDQGWSRQEVPLDEFAGQEVDIVLRADLKEKPSANPGHAYWGEPEIVSETTSPKFLPNVVVISLDTLRADFLGTYGHPNEISQHIDAIAASGTVFDNCISQSSWTRPAHFAMLASRYPGFSILQYNEKFCRISSDVLTLAELLKENDYLTAAFTGGGYMGRKSGFEQGFDYYVSYGRRFEPNLRPVADWLDNHADSRFLLFLHNYNAHNPYDPPEDAKARFVMDPPAACEGVTFSTEDSQAGRVSRCQKDPGVAAYIKGIYAGEVFHVDRLFGDVVSQLKRLGVFEDTIFLITSDHGEGLFDHGESNHVTTMYQELIHVPLILSGPGIPANTRIEHTVQLLDVAPTLLDLLGLEVPENFQGRSLVPLFRELASPRLKAFSATSWDRSMAFAESKPHSFSAATLDDGKKLIRNLGESGDEAELYDIGADPGELSPLEANVPWQADLGGALNSWLRTLSQQDQCEHVAMDPTTMEELKALGYLQ